ncbi:adenylyl-sulfate kinase [Psychrobacillus sp. NPDC096426]|uniref:adenylyl-sulfate kinase n=1 Tax=Psychrobacillus sp. NPDC096426 TaxID=3364491 RepID=UPI003811021E
MTVTQKVIEAIEQLPKLERPYIIGIDGLSGAGKTTITETITQELTSEGHQVYLLYRKTF